MKIEFWSSTEYGGFLEGLMRELRGQGFEAAQRFHISEASYRAARSTPARLFLRLRQYVIYPLYLSVCLLVRRLKGLFDRFRGRSPSDDVCVVSTNTFFAPLLATFLHPRVVHLVYDLFPEAMIHAGKWPADSIKVRAVRWITRKTLQRADLNVFLGQRLQAYVTSIHGPVANSRVIPVGADQSLFPEPPAKASDSVGAGRAPTVFYCGNLGHMHEIQTLMDVWASDPGPLRWCFRCSGPKRAALEAGVKSLPESSRNCIQIGNSLAQADWVEAMTSAEVALVTMAPGAEQVVMPSKTYSAMMAGQAILAIAPEASDLVELIKAADCGWWVEPGDTAALADTLQVITSEPSILEARRSKAYQYAQAHFGQDILANTWGEVLKA